MKKRFNRIVSNYERKAFGVCTWLGDKMRLKTTHIRLAFIYLSFITFGSIMFVYLIAAFVLRNKEYFKPTKKKLTIWEL